ncbi:MAG: nucleotidyl transferase AbiEii/AbiGii toxin family protein [Rhodobacteraceae bacterium]|nr:nucleotidyl transferase AbiEii/AbiGii toxin family protein [Paracoccaceae bacterium]MCY4141053.1 nucleotidyl transferase AbiEii/AbiGii toxin family protein [Paracoccaceae bacterium]
MTQDLSYLVDLAMEDPQLNGMQLVVEKELFHYDILFAMDRGRFLDGLVFQGGTALRLCYGAPRFSEDLDFSGDTDFTSSRLAGLGDYLAKYLSGRYGLETVIKPPSEMRESPDASKLVTDKWRISVVTRPERTDIPRQRIHLEVCNVPSYESTPMSMLRNYDFLPGGYEDFVIRVETRDEILADKLVAFPATLPTYTRWRDLWDMRWLERRGAIVKADLVWAKIRDYRIHGYVALLEKAIDRIPDLIHSDEFVAQMGRFLTEPVAESTIRRQMWREEVIRELGGMLTGLWRQLAPRKDLRPPGGDNANEEASANTYVSSAHRLDGP